MWKKSSFCKADDPMCVEVNMSDGEFVLVRDNMEPRALAMYTKAEWDAFIKGVKAGEFDL